MTQQAEDFDKKLFRIRRELSVLAGYYAQLDDLYAVLADAIPDAEEHVQRLLEHLSGKAQRLLTMTEQEKEYSLQLREMHQTQVGSAAIMARTQTFSPSVRSRMGRVRVRSS